MKKILFIPLVAFAFSSCIAPITPQSRIAADPRTYAALSPKEQNLVSQGQISRGMSPNAVFFAWGNPSQRFEGYSDSKKTTRWDYVGTRPVYTTNFDGGYGYYGHHGPYNHHGYSTFGFGPEIAYVPDRYASVWFVNDRVDSWERSR